MTDETSSFHIDPPASAARENVRGSIAFLIWVAAVILLAISPAVTIAAWRWFL